MRPPCLIFNLGRREHTKPCLIQLHWSPVRYRIQYKLCTLMHNIRSGRAPRYLSDIVQPTSARTTCSGLCSSSAETASYVTRRLHSRTATMSNEFSVNTRHLDRTETNWTCSVCFNVAERTKFRSTLLPKTATVSKQQRRSTCIAFDNVASWFRRALHEQTIRTKIGHAAPKSSFLEQPSEINSLTNFTVTTCKSSYWTAFSRAGKHIISGN